MHSISHTPPFTMAILCTHYLIYHVASSLSKKQVLSLQLLIELAGAKHIPILEEFFRFGFFITHIFILEAKSYFSGKKIVGREFLPVCRQTKEQNHL